MKMQSVYTNPRLLLSTENNKYNICEAIKDEWLDADTIGEIVGVSRSRASVLCRLLGDDGYVEYTEKQMVKEGQNGRRRRYYKALKPYIKKDIQLKDPKDLVRPQVYYGSGKIFNPWEPKLPEGTLREVKLFNEKDSDYFHKPLKKRGAINIGSTFSLYDGATL
jgi:hypothetical protein